MGLPLASEMQICIEAGLHEGETDYWSVVKTECVVTITTLSYFNSACVDYESPGIVGL